MNLVTVYRGFKSAEAQLVRAQLESAGFLVHVAHELSALSIEGYSMAAGGILVQVPEDRAEEARALLASNQEPDSDSES
jgi:hypothetical protein